MNTRYITFLTAIMMLCAVLVSGQNKLVILHTNDTHSRIEPLPDADGTEPGKGGVVRRATYIDNVRKLNKDVLLLDAGDFVQGTPYFNMFKGKVEIEAMNIMKYDAATLGNHEFDYGLQTMADMVKMANFPFVVCNYDFSGTPMEGLTKPYVIFERAGMKIGVIGVGLNPRGMVTAANCEGLVYHEPLDIVTELALKLRRDEQCQLVILLTHIGVERDRELAAQVKGVDIIIGGHSHTYMAEGEKIKSADGRDVMVYQTNGRGVYVGNIEVKTTKSKARLNRHGIELAEPGKNTLHSEHAR